MWGVNVPPEHLHLGGVRAAFHPGGRCLDHLEMGTEVLLVGLCPLWVRFWLWVFTVMDLTRLFSSWVPSLLTGVGRVSCPRLWRNGQGPDCRGCSRNSGVCPLLNESPRGRRQAADKRTGLVAQMVKNLPAYCVEDLGSLPELGRCPGEGNGYPLQYSGLEISVDRGAWWATVHGVGHS